jgi:hypothetical protein
MSDSYIASSAASAPFAEVLQEAEPRAVRRLFGEGAQQEGGPAVASSALPTPFAEVSQAAVQAAVQPLLASATPEPALRGTGFTYRHDWGPRRGQWTLRLNLGGVTPRSRVLVSIGEGVAGGPDAGKFIGSARYTVHNVAPRAGGVDIWVNIEWGSDIRLYADYLVVNP